ncbi:Homeodomain-like protein, partial [Coemansia spiralis]
SSKPGNRKRARATSEQVTVLESVFMVNRSPASRVREDLAARLNMAPRQVQVWFQNRRAKEKTQQRNP